MFSNYVVMYNMKENVKEITEKSAKDLIPIIENIKKTQPDFIFVALGFPRQEQWIASAQKVIGGGVFIGVGGSFDVLAGTVKRAPLFWQNLHLEWLYRLIKQPTRLKRMIALPKFVYHIFKD